MSFWHTMSRRLITNGVLTSSLSANRAVVDCHGYESLTFEFEFTRVAYTALEIVVETSRGDMSNTAKEDQSLFVWKRLQTVSVSSGTATLSDEDNVKTLSVSTNFDLDYDINWPWMRVSIAATNASTDTVICNAILGRQGN